MYPTSVPIVGNSTLSNLSNITGFRVWSDNSTDNIPANVTPVPPPHRYNDRPYSHTWDLTSSDNDGRDATQELQIFNGSYGSKAATANGYLDYTMYNISSTEKNTANYSNISTAGYRFATFCWKCNINLRNYTKIAFMMNGIQQTINNPNATPSVSGQPILFYYRLEDYDNPNEFTTAYINSLWIDANSSTLAISSTNYCKLDLAGYLSGTLLGGKNTSSLYRNTFVDNTLTINASVPSFSISNSTNVYLYLRVGLPMGINVNFTHITCSLYS
jgi:hypothetical protein